MQEIPAVSSILGWDMSTISVIIPAYNAAGTILETITSVLQQTFTDLEIIAIDDGSTDKTLELLHTVSDSRLQVSSYPNGGVCVARNRGIAKARGDFIAFLDADDVWTPDKLAEQYQALQQHPEAGVAYSWAYYMDEAGGAVQPCEPMYFAGDVFAQLLVYDFVISCSNCLIRRQAVDSVGEFDPEVSGAADWDYWLRLAMLWKFVVIMKHQLYYRISSGSMQSNVDFMERCNLKVIEKAYRAAPQKLQSLKNQSLANIYRYSAHLYLTRVKTAAAARIAVQKLWMAVRSYPPFLRDRWVRNLWCKALLMQAIPPQISRPLIQGIREWRLGNG